MRGENTPGLLSRAHVPLGLSTCSSPWGFLLSVQMTQAPWATYKPQVLYVTAAVLVHNAPGGSGNHTALLVRELIGGIPSRLLCGRTASYRSIIIPQVSHGPMGNNPIAAYGGIARLEGSWRTAMLGSSPEESTV